MTWMLEYRYSLLCRKRTQAIIKALTDQDFIKIGSELGILITGVNDLKALSVEGVNIEDVRKHLISALINQKNKFYI